MTICLMIATEKGYFVLRSIKEMFPNISLKVTTFNEINMQESYSEKIQEYCKINDISFSMWGDYKDKFYKDVMNNHFTEVVCIGWRYLIDPVVNQYLRHKLIVFHDSILPKYRGFAPLPTAMINREKEIGVTVLYGENEMDSGLIIFQQSILLDHEKYIKDVIEELSKVYGQLAIKLIAYLLNNKPLPVASQLNQFATYSCWRDEMDYRIDWKESCQNIHSMVRALSYPYKGAFTILNNKIVRIKKASIVDDVNFAIRYPGKVWSLENGVPVVICGQGLIKLDEIVTDDGDTVFIDKLRTRFD